MRGASTFGAEARLLAGDELRRRLPEGARAGWSGALFAPHDGRAEPHLASAAIARAARKLGAQIFTR